MDCQGAQDEPEGRPGGPGDLKKQLGWVPPLALLPLPGPPGLPSVLLKAFAAFAPMARTWGGGTL